MKKIVIIPNATKDKGYKSALAARDILEGLGCRCAALEGSGFPGADELSEAEAFSGADAALCLGGDGTMLCGTRLASEYGVPVLGVNLGRVGFLTALGADELSEVAALAGEFEVHERMMLDVAVLRGGAVLFADRAVNDVALTRGLSPQSISLDFAVDGYGMGAVWGDGIIVSTPAGSTGYALSAGGPAVEPEMDAVILTPVCSHAHGARPFVLSPERTVTVTSDHFARREVYISVDGRESRTLEEGDTVVLRRSERRARFVALPGRTFLRNYRMKISR